MSLPLAVGHEQASFFENRTVRKVSHKMEITPFTPISCMILLRRHPGTTSPLEAQTISQTPATNKPILQLFRDAVLFIPCYSFFLYCIIFGRSLLNYEQVQTSMAG
jgi:hypothetical protein